MRPDQIQRLKELQEKLAEVVLHEADPDNWPGEGTPMDQWSREERGDRYWCKKNAAATFALLERTTWTLDYTPFNLLTPAQQDVDLERQVQKREREAIELLSKVQDKARKTAFDAKTLGKR